jgi:asparagine synthetase B (glutamine-hydrolysing)
MCGIFCSLSRAGYITPDEKTQRLLQNRGPDHIGTRQIVLRDHGSIVSEASAAVHATFLSTVLALRGSAIVEQPLVDATTGSVLCWNGEAWSIGGQLVVGNDSQIIFSKLLQASATSVGGSEGAVLDLLSSIRGPYALVFHDARNKRVYYGRDCLGRRSLLRKSRSDGSLVLSSVCDNASGEAWAEVEADGIYIMNFESGDCSPTVPTPTLVRHCRSDQAAESELSFVGEFSASRLLLM